MELHFILEEPASFASQILEQMEVLVFFGVIAKLLRVSEGAKTGKFVENLQYAWLVSVMFFTAALKVVSCKDI